MFVLIAQSAPNFAGTWTLDKNNSQNLPSWYRAFERISLLITQTDKEISIEEKFFGSAVTNLPAAGPGHGAGMGRPIGPRTYNLDGSETATEIEGTKFFRQAILSSDGKTLELVEKTATTGIAGEVTLSNKLSLSTDGKVLTVSRHREGSTNSQILIFNK